MVSVVKNLPANAGDVRDAGSIPALGRSPGGEYGTPLHYSCLENPMDRGAWRATVHRISKSRTWLSDSAQHSTGVNDSSHPTTKRHPGLQGCRNLPGCCLRPSPRPQGRSFPTSHTRGFLRWSYSQFINILKPGRTYLSSWECLSQHFFFLQSPLSRTETFRLHQVWLCHVGTTVLRSWVCGVMARKVLRFLSRLSFSCSFK